VTYDIEYSGPGLGQAHKCGGIKLINRIPTFKLSFPNVTAELIFTKENVFIIKGNLYWWNSSSSQLKLSFLLPEILHFLVQTQKRLGFFWKCMRDICL
jgi:hypothetical protein